MLRGTFCQLNRTVKNPHVRRRSSPWPGFGCKVLHYKVPEALRGLAAVGSLVSIPVGHATRLGVIGGIGPPKDFPLERLKSVAQIVYPFPALDP